MTAIRDFSNCGNKKKIKNKIPTSELRNKRKKKYSKKQKETGERVMRCLTY